MLITQYPSYCSCHAAIATRQNVHNQANKTKANATMPTVGKEDEPLTPAQMAINAVKVFFALSPLLALFYVLLSGFESDDKENAKRNKKGFSLDGHGD